MNIDKQSITAGYAQVEPAIAGVISPMHAI
jgi:hypothetical protein